MRRMTALTGALIIIALLFTGCADADVVLKYSQKSFEDIIKTFPNINSEAGDNYYILTVDGETSLEISKNYADTGNGDILLSTPLKPFIDAGLDISKLSGDYKTDKDNFYLAGDFGNGSGAEATVDKALFESVKNDRAALSYHEALDHYGIALPGGKFEFAKDYKTNDKDVVFVINAKPLSDIGVDVHHIDGWTFKTMQDNKGVDVDVLLKPYDLK